MLESLGTGYQRGIQPGMVAYAPWLSGLAWGYLSLCLACALGLAIHTLLRPQKMWIMSVVWPVTGLYMGPMAVLMYSKSLSLTERRPMPQGMERIEEKYRDAPPTFFQNCLAVFHCGAGCALGDIAAESAAPALGLVFAGEFGSRLVLDFVFAYALGVAFQYFTIAPMRGLGLREGLLAAVRADTASIALFEMGMFGWMAISWYLLFPRPHLDPGMAVFWFMMQIAMIAGFFTALPANAWLIRKGWKEKMPSVNPGQMQAEIRELGAAGSSQR